MLRALATVILLISILFMPIWVSFILALAGMAYFSLFLEAVVLFLLSDLLFGVAEARFLGVVLISVIISILLLAAAEFLKKSLKFYP